MKSQKVLFKFLLRNALALAFFAAVAIIISGNAAAQAICSRNAMDPHSFTENGCSVGTGSFAIDSNPDRVLSCGSCTVDLNGCGTRDPDDVLYVHNGHNFCGPQTQCDAVMGMLSDGTTCMPLPHQNCYENNFRTPIATRVFDTNEMPPDGACRAATNAAEDIAICAAITPASRAPGGGAFETVIDGACAQDETCGTASPFKIQPDLIQLVRAVDSNLVGICVSETDCTGGAFRGVADSGECRLPTSSAECVSNSRDPIYDPTIPDLNKCRLPTDDSECMMAYPTTQPFYDEDEPDNCRADIIVDASHHQACHDRNFLQPIAIRGFQGTPQSGECRAAVEGDAADIATCRLIDPAGAFGPDRYMAVVDGACARNSSCSSGEFLSKPELYNQGQPLALHSIGSCQTAEVCRAGDPGGILAGYPDRDENECRLPMENGECFVIDESMPIYDMNTGVCRAEEEDDCEEYEEFDAGCRPRAAGDCSNTEGFMMDPGGTGGTCVQCPTGGTSTATGGMMCQCPDGQEVFENSRCEASLEGTCSDFEEYRSMTNICDLRVARDCPPNEEFMEASGGAGGTCVRCPTGGTSTGGAPCACSSGEMVFDQGTPEDRSDDVCMVLDVNTCAHDEIISETGRCTECGMNQIRDTNNNDMCACEDGYDNIGSENALDCVMTCEGNEEFSRTSNRCECPDMGHLVIAGVCVVRVDPDDCPRNAEINESANRCECSNRMHQVFNNGTLEDASDDFCAALAECPDTYEPDAANECACPGAQREFNAGTPDDPGDDFCAETRACVSNEIYNSNTNECACPGRTHESLANGACVETCRAGETRNATTQICESICGGSEVYNIDAASCECAPGFEGMPGNCAACTRGRVSRSGGEACACPEGQQEFTDGCATPMSCGVGLVRLDDNTCAEICEENGVRQPDNSCLCNENFERIGTECLPECPADEIRISGFRDCVERAACPGGTTGPDNICICPDGEEDFNGACIAECGANEGRDSAGRCECLSGHEDISESENSLNCVPRCGSNETRRSGGACICMAGYEDIDGSPNSLSCVPACRADEERIGRVCACPSGTEEFDNGTPSDSSDDFCEVDRNCPPTYIQRQGACICPSGYRETLGSAAGDPQACALVPASSDDDDDGAFRAIAPAGVVGLLAYAYIYPDFGFDSAFDFSGENENLSYTGGLSAQFEHGDFRSFVRASHSSSEDWIVMESGTEYSGGLFIAAYNALESKDELMYEIEVKAPAEFMMWEISPHAAVELNHQREDNEWRSESGAGFKAVWAAHRWNVQASSGFAFGGDSHAIEIVRQF